MMTVHAQHDQEDAAPYWSPGRRHLVLALLCTIGFFNLFDRQALTILLEPIKREFAASDTAMGFLAGSVFALFYATAAIPLGGLADRYPRGLLISACLLVWSSMTMLGGLAGSFVQLALTRVGVAVGEAGSSPVGTAMIADLYPLRHRAKAIALFAAASSIGAGVAVMLAGWFVERLGWRLTLALVGAPGSALALLLLWTLKDPPRGLSDPARVDRSDDPFAFSEVFGYLWRLRSYLWIMLTPAFGQMALFGTLTWAPSFLMRTHALTPAEVGLAVGGVSTLALVLGQLAGGLLADWAGGRDFRGSMWVAAAAGLLGIPFGMLFVFAADVRVAMVGFGVLTFCMAPITVCGSVMAQTLVPPRMRAMSSTVLMIAGTVFGVGLAPFLIGMANDLLWPRFGDGAIRYSLAVASGVLALSSASALMAARWVRFDYEGMLGFRRQAGTAS